MFSLEAVAKKFFEAEGTQAPIKCVSLGNKGDYVILIPGIWNIPFSLRKITDSLDEAGYCVIPFKYKSRGNGIDTVSLSILTQFINRHCIDVKKKINFVTYSTGGIILRRYLDQNKLLQLGRVVMIAPPNHGSELSDFFKKYINFIYKFLFGTIGQQLGTRADGYIHKQLNQSITYDLGIIAGQEGMGLLSYLIIGKPSDGAISVESTKLQGMSDHTIIPATHNLILFFKYTARKVLNFIRDGAF